MKQRSILKRITTWYALLMTLVVFVMFVGVTIMSQILVKQELRRDLISSLNHLKTQISVEDQYLDFENVETFRNQTYLSIYDEYGNVYLGQIPKIFDVETPFSNNKLIEKTYSNNEKILYYDESYSIEGYGNFWLRGIIFYTSTQLSIQKTINLVLIALILMLVLISLGGYYLTKRALKPVETIRKRAQEIGEGKDLHLRLPIQKPKDELSRLSETFNLMLNRLEDAFMREEQFSYDISHELKTPLSVMILEIESLQAKSKDPQVLSTLNLLEQKSKQMQSLTQQLLLLARTNHETYPLDLETIDLQEIIEMILSSFEYSDNDKNIRFVLQVDPNTKLHADLGLLIRLFENLIENSIKYGSTEGTTYIKSKIIDDLLEISFSDNGIGIPSQHLDKIWDRLYQVDTSKNNQANSYGLGLAIVKWIVDLHKWDIHVESKVGIGTTFKILIPL